MKILSIAAVLMAVLTTGGCNDAGHDNSKNTAMEKDQSKAYACPMHPEITGSKGDKCSKCGMELEPLKNSPAGNIEMKLISPSGDIASGKPATLSFKPVNNNEPGKSTELEVRHEKKFHLIVVSDDLSWFHHIHPEQQADGSFTVAETFPAGGHYWLFADFKPIGMEAQVQKIPLTVQGTPAGKKDFTTPSLVSKVDGYTLTFTNGDALETNKTVQAGISIEKDGQQLRSADLEKYLGANAHIVLISVSDKEFIHIHPGANETFPVYGQTGFSKPGLYRMWLQFKTGGRLHTADFTVNVKEGTSETKAHADHSNH